MMRARAVLLIDIFEVLVFHYCNVGLLACVFFTSWHVPALCLLPYSFFAPMLNSNVAGFIQGVW